MRAVFVVHENTPMPGKAGASSVVLRPVVNEADTNRSWSPGTTPAGELRLQITQKDLAGKLKPGARLGVTFDLEASPAPVAAKTPTK